MCHITDILRTFYIQFVVRARKSSTTRVFSTIHLPHVVNNEGVIVTASMYVHTAILLSGYLETLGRIPSFEWLTLDGTSNFNVFAGLCFIVRWTYPYTVCISKRYVVMMMVIEHATFSTNSTAYLLAVASKMAEKTKKGMILLKNKSSIRLHCKTIPVPDPPRKAGCSSRRRKNKGKKDARGWSEKQGEFFCLNSSLLFSTRPEMSFRVLQFFSDDFRAHNR